MTNLTKSYLKKKKMLSKHRTWYVLLYYRHYFARTSSNLEIAILQNNHSDTLMWPCKVKGILSMFYNMFQENI